MIIVDGMNRSLNRSMVFPYMLANAVCILIFGLTNPSLHADDSTIDTVDATFRQGQIIYRRQCASCHGERGEGVEGNFEKPLVGDDSIGQLRDRIVDTMPEDDPESCVGADAQAVAAYIHAAFYSEAARLRNRPPRRRLTHLTSRQLRQSLADLYAHFTQVVTPTKERGLLGQYFDSSNFGQPEKKFERIDDRLDFDWQHEGPGEGITADDFGVRWRGGLKVEETGRYQIVIRSTCAFACDLGAADRVFVDNLVQSGDKTEFRRPIVLTAGRVVPIRIKLLQRKRKTEQPPATISLSWIPPHGVEQVIPRRHLLPIDAPATFSLQARLPPDDRSYGYDRGLAIDRQWDDSTTAAALEFAGVCVEELWPRYRQRHKEMPPEQVIRQFLGGLAKVAFRGEVEKDLLDFYVEDQLDATEDHAESIVRSVLAILKSPRFLYPDLDEGQADSRRAANRLALTLYDSLPADRWLMERIDQEQLQTEAEVRDVAQQMLDDYRTHAKTRQLLYEWLNLSQFEEIIKDPEVYPEFDARLVADLKASLDLFLDDVTWSADSDFRQLLLASWSYVTPRMAEFMGPQWQIDGQQANTFVRTAEGALPRMGLMSHPYLMSRLAYQDSTSPIHRGVFLMRYVLGRTLRPPQEAFTPLSPELHPDLTTRQRVILQTSSQSCQVCHQKINGLGFTLEQFDGVGRYRELEDGKPIDASGEYTDRSGAAFKFQNASELAVFLAKSEDTQKAFVNRVFQYFVKQPIAAYGVDQLDRLTTAFRANNFSIQQLLVEVAVIAAQPSVRSAEES